MSADSTAGTGRLGVVIAAYGRNDLTVRVVEELRRDIAPEQVRVLVVDNAGDVSLDAGVEVIRPPRNLGWLMASNLGMDVLFADRDVEAVVLLNNDTRLSRGFLAGLLDAQHASGGALVGPTYDGGNALQHPVVAATATDYEPVAEEVEVPWLEGTCMLVTRRVHEDLGDLDETRFGLWGWGADLDLCLRVRARGWTIVVTRRSFLEHEGGATARAEVPGYYRWARRELTSGLRGRWGRRWFEMLDFEDPRQRTKTRRGRVRVRGEEMIVAVRRRVEVHRRRRALQAVLEGHHVRGSIPGR